MRGRETWVLVLVLALVTAACAPTPPMPSSPVPASQIPTAPPSSASTLGSATLVVTQAFIGEGFYTEGAFAYVELLDASGAVIERLETSEYRLEQELARFVIDPGSYELRSYVRSCNGACQALDSPSAACVATIEMKSGDEVTVLIERTLSSCDARSL